MAKLLRRRRRQERPLRTPPARKRKVTLTEILDYFVIRYFSGIGEWIDKQFEMEKNLRKAGMLVYHKLYSARIAAMTVMSFILAVYFSIIIALLDISLIIKVLAVLFLMLSPIIVFVSMLIYPSIKQGQRKQKVETELPFFAAYLATMVRAGVSVSKILERVSQLKIFDAMRKEALIIVRNINMFGEDPLKAIEDHVIDHPSYKFREFMLGYTTTVKTGGDVTHYIEIRTQDIFSSRMNDLKLIAERTSMFTEIYITVAVIMTIVFYVFFTISSIFPAAGGFGGIAQLTVFSFVILPMLTIFILYLIHSNQPKTPIKIKEPIAYMILLGVPASIVVGVVSYYATGANLIFDRNVINFQTITGLTLTLSLALIALSLPPAISYITISRRHTGLAEATASFLRDLTEIRKTGLSPEKSILSLMERNYGKLTPILRKAGAALLLGLGVEKALASALKGYKDWMLLANMRFLADTIELGGGSPETLDALAKYSFNLVELDKETKKKLRTYIVMPYLGAILVASSSLLILNFTSQTLTEVANPGAGMGGGLGGGNISPETLKQIAMLLSLSAVFNSFLMGIVAGKIQSQTIAAGFVHSILLIIITLITVIVTLSKIAIL